MSADPFAGLLTPALLIDLDAVDHNIATTVRLLGGDARRWRPHVKTSKLDATLRRLVAGGVTQMKCATTLELRTALAAGATDVLVAYPLTDAAAARAREIAQQFPQARVSALVDRPSQFTVWQGGTVGLMIDVNSGMNRTGVAAEPMRIVRLAREITERGIEFRGLHWYEGHLTQADITERTRLAHEGYDQLMKIVEGFENARVPVGEVITSGTPAFPCALRYAGFTGGSFLHQASPGTLVYCDVRSEQQLPREFGYRHAVTVLSTVVSHPLADVVTCDAGHKTVSADAGIPNCRVLDREGLTPLHPSEEHLPIRVAAGAQVPDPGEVLRLLPLHVCPTVNNFDHAVLLRGGAIVEVAPVSARGRETPLAAAGAESTPRVSVQGA